MHPQQKNCNPDDPKKMAAWVWAAGVPDMRPTVREYVPLVMPQLTEGISQMLWDFGFRHHPDQQTRWIEGGAGLGMVARLVDKPPRDFVAEGGEQFLAANNPELLKKIKEATPAERARLKQELQKNFEQIEQLLNIVEEAD